MDTPEKVFSYTLKQLQDMINFCTEREFHSRPEPKKSLAQKLKSFGGNFLYTYNDDVYMKFSKVALEHFLGVVDKFMDGEERGIESIKQAMKDSIL